MIKGKASGAIQGFRPLNIQAERNAAPVGDGRGEDTNTMMACSADGR